MAGYDPRELDGAPVPVLLELLAGANPTERADAACAFGDRLRTREIAAYEAPVQERLADLLGDPVPMVRFEAAIALAEAGDTRATDVLVAALRSRALRLDATRALGATGDRRAIPPLARVLRHWLMPWADRLQAAAALCALNDPEGAAYLKNKLASRRQVEQAVAVHFLGEARHPEARVILEGILGEKGYSKTILKFSIQKC